MTVLTLRQVIDEPTSLQKLFSDPRLAVREDCIVCLICGAPFRQLTNTHLRAHGTGVAEYRARFGYNRRRALMCRALRRLYTERAVRAGLAGRILHRPIVETPELRRLGGARSIALEERLTRREAQRQASAARLARKGRASKSAPPAAGSRRAPGARMAH
jgi:ROS/MUCR transcriptional regulator protein